MAQRIADDQQPRTSLVKFAQSTIYISIVYGDTRSKNRNQAFDLRIAIDRTLFFVYSIAQVIYRLAVSSMDKLKVGWKRSQPVVPVLWPP